MRDHQEVRSGFHVRTSVRFRNPVSPVTGSSARPKRIPGPDRRNLRRMVQNSRASRLRCASGSHARCACILRLSTTNGTGVLPAGSHIVSALSSKAQAAYLHRIRGCAFDGGSIQAEVQPIDAPPSRAHAPGHRASVHHCIRRGELLKLTEADYDRREATLHIRATKFYKSRLLPIHEGIANEIEKYLSVRAKLKLPSSPDTPLIWNATRGGRPYTGTSISYCIKPLLHQCGIKAASGRTPRIHDFRHAFAVNALLRWYRSGADVDARLPLLATYMGHGSALSTHHYLHFIEPMRAAASERFARRYGSLIVPPVSKKGRSR